MSRCVIAGRRAAETGAHQDDWVQRLEDRRQELQLSRVDMAKRCGVQYSAYSHWVNRRREPDKIATYVQIAAAIDKHPAWLLFGVPITAATVQQPSTPLRRRLPSKAIEPARKRGESNVADSAPASSIDRVLLDYDELVAIAGYKLLLDYDELVAITGYKRPKAQAEFIRRNFGIPAAINALNEVVVLRTHLQASGDLPDKPRPRVLPTRKKRSAPRH